MIALGRQLAKRIEAWRQALAAELYTPLCSIDFEGFVTKDNLSPAQADAHERAPYPAGTAWGAKWEYGWFFGTVTLPPQAQGRRIVLFSGLGGEQLVYADGQALGSIDRRHGYVTISRCAVAGETVGLAVESYAGHGPRLENTLPCPPEKQAIPDTPTAQCRVGASCIALWNEEAYQLHIDVETLWSLLEALPDRSLRAQKVARALEDFTCIADFEANLPARTQSFVRARQALAPALMCRNGSTAPVMSIVGQSHIDLAWMWPLEETRHKSARTFSNQLTLMDEYPEYRFLLCEPALLRLLKQQDAALYGRVVQAVKRGQMLPEGAFDVECDCNMPCGESLIRQITRGKRWFKDELGVEVRVAWQPDTFGFSAALPQILKGCGVDYFATQKLLRQDPECQPFPYQNFLWEGMDGTTVKAHMFFKENAPMNPKELCTRWEQNRVQQRDIDGMLYPFGYGDGGGGATRDMVEAARRLEDLEGAPRTRYEGLRAFFDRMPTPDDRWVGELYLAWHRGAYTAQRRTKALCRRLEFALRETEALLAQAPDEAGARAVDAAWDTLGLCQFHDVLGGVGIARVHQEAERDLTAALDELNDVSHRLRTQLYGITPEEGSYTAINPLPWKRREWVRLDGEWRLAQAPAMGAQTVADMPVTDPVRIWREDGLLCMANGRISLKSDERGRLSSVRLNGRELVRTGGLMNDWRLYQDINPDYDAWELACDWRKNRVDAAFTSHATLTEQGGAVGEITVESAFGKSRATQRIRLYAGGGRVEFATEVHWQERHRLLKAHFESDVLAGDMQNEIQFGYVDRPAHRSHAFAADRYETCQYRYSALCEENWGFALLNDGLCGVSADRGEMALSLLRAPLVPDDTCDRGVHRFTYALMPFDAHFAESGVTRAAAELNQPLRLMNGRCQTQSGFELVSGSAVLETVKPTEGGLTLRLYESARMRGWSVLRLPFDADVYACDMAETAVGEKLASGREIALDFRPFEIRTLRVVKRER